MLISSPRLMRALYTIILTHWAVSAWATVAVVNNAPPDLLTLPWAAIGISMLLSIWGGLIATLGKLNRVHPDEPHPRQVRSLYIELIKDLLASTGAGFIAFLTGTAQSVNIYVLCILLFGAGYAGTKVIDAAGDVVVAMLRAIGGRGHERRDRWDRDRHDDRWGGR